MTTQQPFHSHLPFPLLPGNFSDSSVTHEAMQSSAGQGGIRTPSPEVSGKDTLFLRKRKVARAWQAGTAPAPPCPTEKADTMLTHDLEEADLMANANIIRMGELQEARRSPALNDIRDLMHQAEPTLPRQSRCSSQPSPPGFSVTYSSTRAD